MAKKGQKEQDPTLYKSHVNTLIWKVVLEVLLYKKNPKTMGPLGISLGYRLANYLYSTPHFSYMEELKSPQ